MWRRFVRCRLRVRFVFAGWLWVVSSTELPILRAQTRPLSQARR